MDDGTWGALLGGVVLVDASARRAERAMQRSIQRDLSHQLLRFRRVWRHRAETGAAFVGGIAGAGLLLYALSRHHRSLPSAGAAPLEANGELELQVVRDAG
jgi:hypothetical protein